MLKLAVGMPAYGGRITAGQARMWMQIGARILTRRSEEKCDLVSFANVDVCGIDHARNHLVDISRAASADWLIMIDSDTWIDPGGGIIDAILEAEKREAAMVGVPVPLKDGTHLNVYGYSDGGKLRLVPVTQSVEIYEVDGIGGAVIAIHLERIGDAKFKFTDGTGEDLGFCDQLRKAKRVILCDPRVKSYHVDRPNVLTYDAEDFK